MHGLSSNTASKETSHVTSRGVLVASSHVEVHAQTDEVRQQVPLGGVEVDWDRFWELVETADPMSEDGCDRLTERLATTLSPEEIEGFARTLDELCAAAYRWDLWGAAYLANGGCSDDGFDYFRAWLVAQGRAVYQAAMDDPDTLATVVVPDTCECESLLYVADEAYEQATGDPLPSNANTGSDQPAGELWDFEDADEMRRRYPRLCQRVDYE